MCLQGVLDVLVQVSAIAYVPLLEQAREPIEGIGLNRVAAVRANDARVAGPLRRKDPRRSAGLVPAERCDERGVDEVPLLRSLPSGDRLLHAYEMVASPTVLDECVCHRRSPPGCRGIEVWSYIMVSVLSFHFDEGDHTVPGLRRDGSM